MIMSAFIFPSTILFHTPNPEVLIRRSPESMTVFNIKAKVAIRQQKPTMFPTLRNESECSRFLSILPCFSSTLLLLRRQPADHNCRNCLHRMQGTVLTLFHVAGALRSELEVNELCLSINSKHEYTH